MYFLVSSLQSEPLERSDDTYKRKGKFPPRLTRFICSGVQVSRIMERTNVICVPRDLWLPAQSKQIKVPKPNEDHDGLGALQSTHLLFLSVSKMLMKCSGVGSWKIWSIGFLNYDGTQWFQLLLYSLLKFLLQFYWKVVLMWVFRA